MLRFIGSGIAVALVVSSAEAQAPPTWRLADRPLFLAGGNDSPNETFTSITGAIRLRDGRFAVADGREDRITIFAPNGRQLHRFGRKGSGPGEFRALYGIWLAGADTIATWDPNARRITHFLPDGTVTATHVVKLDSEPPAPGNLDGFLGALPDGRIVLAWIAARRAAMNGFEPDRMSFGVFSPQGVFERVLGSHTGMIRTMVPGNGGPIVFSPFPYAAVTGTQFVYTNGTNGELIFFDARRGVQSTPRSLTVRSQPIALAAAWRAFDAAADNAPENRPMFAIARNMDRSFGSVPLFARMFSDDRGNLWLKEYNPAADAMPFRSSQHVAGGRWRIVRTDGSAVATIAMPAGVAPIAVYGDQLLAVVRDEFDVEQFGVFRLIR